MNNVSENMPKRNEKVLMLGAGILLLLAIMGLASGGDFGMFLGLMLSLTGIMVVLYTFTIRRIRIGTHQKGQEKN